MRGFLNHQQRSRHRQWGLCGGGGPSAARGGVLLLKVLLVATVLAAAVRAAAGKQVASSTTSVAVSAPERGVVTASAASAQGKRVVALSSKDFFSKLKDGQPLLVSFIAPSWCVHCVRLLPILEALAYEVRDEASLTFIC
jgi:thiol-disulfide isomerase/thioredoxin